MNTLEVRPADDADATGLGADEFDALDAILDELRTRDDETPQWEFCEGFMAALICCRRPIPPADYLPLLLGGDPEAAAPDAGTDRPAEGIFADAAQAAHFLGLWQRRWREVEAALDAEVESLDDDRAYAPEVMDLRGMVAALPEDERATMQAQMGGERMPAFAQVWAIGFMYAVENWPEEWQPPRDREAASLIDDSLEAMVALTEDDSQPPTLSALDEDGPPSVSEARLNDYAAAIWAVYDLRKVWRSIGPRVETIRRAPQPGRNDPCPCGSGRKYKKCHGA